MTPEAIATRNRANAAGSTGPRTAEGKATVARNARRHGATAAPDPDRVLTWLRIIRNDPDLDASKVYLRDEGTSVALALAAAEVRYAAAARALQDFEGGRAPLSPWAQDLQQDADMIRAFLAEDPYRGRDRRRAMAIVSRYGKMIATDSQPGGNRHRLLRRYLSEARSRRNKAFAAWIAHERGGRASALQPEAAISRNKARSKGDLTDDFPAPPKPASPPALASRSSMH